jgi:Ca2+-binding EF-hand superfamily protein
MKHMTIAGALALGLAFPVAAQAPMGPISKADFLARGKAQFDAADANHDGVLTRDELVAVMTQQMGSAPAPQLVDSVYTAMDLDHDGKVTAAEAAKLRADSFDRMDANHDGSFSPEEMEAARAAAMAAQQQQPPK